MKNERAAKIYEGRRKPKSGIEEKWPSEVRRTYGRLRTGHAKELKAYRHFIQIEEDARCEECGAEEETISTFCVNALPLNYGEDATTMVRLPSACWSASLRNADKS